MYSLAVFWVLALLAFILLARAREWLGSARVGIILLAPSLLADLAESRGVSRWYALPVALALVLLLWSRRFDVRTQEEHED